MSQAMGTTDPLGWRAIRQHMSCVLKHVIQSLKMVEMFTSGSHVQFLLNFSKINYKQAPNFCPFKTSLVKTLEQLDNSWPHP